MKFMIIVKASPESEAGVMPGQGIFDAMAQYHEALDQAGALVDAAGLRPSANGFRIRWSGGRKMITDGPFAETKELVAGFTLIDVASREEALDWAMRYPNPGTEDGQIEVRQLFELDDFEPGVAIERFRALSVGE